MYTIQKHPFDYTVGVDKDGNRVLMGLLYPYIATALFDAKGSFLEVRIRSVAAPARSFHKNGPYLIEEPEFELKLNEQVQGWQDELGFCERSISVNRFLLKDFSIGIEDLPTHFQRFRENAEEFTEEEKREFPELIASWISEGNFVLRWGKDYYLNKDGEII